MFSRGVVRVCLVSVLLVGLCFGLVGRVEAVRGDFSGSGINILNGYLKYDSPGVAWPSFDLNVWRMFDAAPTNQGANSVEYLPNVTSFAWRDLQPDGPGYENYKWGPLDDALVDASNRGVSEIVFVLTAPPDWATRPDVGAPSCIRNVEQVRERPAVQYVTDSGSDWDSWVIQPADFSETCLPGMEYWRQYVIDVTSRINASVFRLNGGRVVYQVWNEPDNPQFLRDSSGFHYRYLAEMTLVAYQIIHGSRSGLLASASVTSPLGDSVGRVRRVGYFRALDNVGCPVDVIASNVYPDVGGMGSVGSVVGFDRLVGDYSSGSIGTLKGDIWRFLPSCFNGGLAKPLWITELNFRDSSHWKRREIFAGVFLGYVNALSKVDRVIWYGWNNTEPGSKGNPSGLLQFAESNHGGPTLAAVSLKRVFKFLNGWKFLKVDYFGDDLVRVTFSRGIGKGNNFRIKKLYVFFTYFEVRQVNVGKGWYVCGVISSTCRSGVVKVYSDRPVVVIQDISGWDFVRS